MCYDQIVHPDGQLDFADQNADVLDNLLAQLSECDKAAWNDPAKPIPILDLLNTEFRSDPDCEHKDQFTQCVLATITGLGKYAADGFNERQESRLKKAPV